MASNQKSFNFGLSYPYPKLPKNLSKKSTFSKFSSENLELHNPKPIPYQRSVFQPSTISKIIDIPKRFINGFTDPESLENQPQRGIILHTERYVWNSMKDIFKTGNQNERLSAEENYLRKVKYLKKMSENRVKFPSQNFLLEGENLYSSQPGENVNLLYMLYKEGKHDSPTTVHRHGMIPPAPTIIGSLHESEKDPNLSQTCFVAVQKINLKTRIPGMDNVTSAPSDQRARMTLNNIYQNMNSKMPNDKLPPILNNLMDLDSQGRQSQVSFSSHSDLESGVRRSENLNQSCGRINNYIMDGKPMKFNERSDIQGELKYLKSIILPTIARELYVGRGIRLPANHATRNPRGKYFENNNLTKPFRSSELVIETKGGGSVIISTNTPIDETVMTKSVDNEDQMEIVIQNNEITKEEDKHPNNPKEILEYIKINLTKDDDGNFMSEGINEVFQRNPNFSQEWKDFVATIFQSVIQINTEQLEWISETENLCRHFQTNLPSFDREQANQLIPRVFILLQSENAVKLEDVVTVLSDASPYPDLIQQTEEIYKKFAQLISPETRINFEDIPKPNVLLFIPYFMRELKQ